MARRFFAEAIDVGPGADHDESATQATAGFNCKVEPLVGRVKSDAQVVVVAFCFYGALGNVDGGMYHLGFPVVGPTDPFGDVGGVRDEDVDAIGGRTVDLSGSGDAEIEYGSQGYGESFSVGAA